MKAALRHDVDDADDDAARCIVATKAKATAIKAAGDLIFEQRNG